MMEENDQREFTVSFDKKEHEADHAQEILESKVDSLGWKVTFLSIIVPCLIAVIVVVAYFSIREKVSSYRDIGTSEIKEISHVLEMRMADLNQHQKNLQTRMSNMLPEIENNRTVIKKVQYNLNAAKTSRDSLARSIVKLEKDLTTWSKQVADVLETAAENRQQNDILNKNIVTLRESINKMDREKASRSELERVIGVYEQKTRTAIAADLKILKKQIQELQQRIENAESFSPATATPSPSVPGSRATEEQQTAPDAGDDTGITENPLAQ